MADDVKPEVIKKTQDLLGKYFKKPPLTEKLLRKPPFRFLHDIVSVVIRETGFLEGLFTEEELNSDNIKDKESKIAYLTKLIDVVKLISGSNLTVRASKIVSGQEATKTNELLQTIGKALDKKVNSAEAIEHYKKSLQKKSKGGTKLKPKEDAAKRTSRQPSQTRKPPDKEKLTSGPQKRSSSTGKVVSKTKEESNQEDGNNKKNELVEEKIQENNIGKSSDIDIPPAEPFQDEVSSLQKKRHSSATKQKQNHVSSAIPTEVQTNKLPTSLSIDKRLDERSQRKESASRKQMISKQGSESKESIKTISETMLTRTKSIDSTDKEKLKLENGSTNENIITVNSDLQQQGNDKSTNEQEQSVQENTSKSRTLLRPPSARPGSARPAAPKMKAKNELMLNEEISTPMGNITVIIENANTKEDDDNEDMVVVENKGNIGATLESNGNYKIDNELTQEHGHLVAQILETQRELVNTDNVDVLPKKVDIAWEAGTKRDHDAAIKEVDKLRGTIQTLTRATNPLGKLLDYLQEDIEMMQKELHDWRNQYNQLSEQLEKEQIRTQEAIDPMKMTLKEIDNNIQDQLSKIYQSKARIIKNNQKIQRLLNGDV
ncbi:hypothetical protein KPH14_005806 [Odynerus spinipes]|uniref:TRAF3-interacting protein 1 n=1 Tax=Odynerus spinipes TaxID=1348599 RepID=A0AAD9RBM9_9HYME|nr:hypothetical protein KPH14_005806 [Odynerus spinipes]